MRILNQLEPVRVFSHFEALCAIPHGSGNTKAISDYCARFAQEHGLFCQQDAYNNVIIKKPATAGYEQAPAVILQGHLDMVCEKAAGCDIDFSRDGLHLRVDGDCIFADGTTLGGDDGIAIAMALAVLESDDLPHPALEAVFTVDEEIGMLGAEALDCSSLTGQRMLNIDSEEEGVLTVSCAGGATVICRLDIARETADGLTAMQLTLSGLTGGHSGVEIQTGRGNASILLGRILQQLSAAAPIRLISLAGGQKDNAIPVRAEAVIAMPAGCAAAIQKAAEDCRVWLRAEYGVTDPDAALLCTACPAPDLAPLTGADTARLLDFLTLAPNGVQAMSADIPGLVQTSLNLGILQLGDTALETTFCVRSSLDSQKSFLINQLQRLTAHFGGQCSSQGVYPGWAYRRDSTLRDIAAAVYTAQYGAAPKIEAIHAGLECGIFAGKLPGLDCISFGPNMTGIHTVRETLSISSVQRVWNFLCEVLRQCRE